MLFARSESIIWGAASMPMDFGFRKEERPALHLGMLIRIRSELKELCRRVDQLSGRDDFRFRSSGSESRGRGVEDVSERTPVCSAIRLEHGVG